MADRAVEARILGGFSFEEAGGFGELAAGKTARIRERF
jgi:hypothetical protein